MLDDREINAALESLAELDELVEPQVVQSCVRFREIASLLGIVLLSDAVIYMGHGYAGLSAFIPIISSLLWLGAARRSSAPSARLRRPKLLMATVLLLLAARLLWCGDWLSVAMGCVLDDVAGRAAALSFEVRGVLGCSNTDRQLYDRLSA